MKWEVKSEDTSVRKIQNTIKKDGIENLKPIEVIEHNGEILFVDVHHKLAAAKELGYGNIPINT